MTRAELLSELFSDWPHRQAAVTSFEEWLVSSRRFAAFVEAHLTKVRKKLRTAGDEDGALDVLYELEVAHRLVSVKPHGLSYEPFGSKEPGPDFAVTFNGRPWFLLEVTRHGEPGASPQRLARAVALKLRQLRSEGPNVVLVGIDGAIPSEEELGSALASAAHDAETAQADHFARLGLRDRKAFFRHYERLAAVMVRPAGQVDGGAKIAQWFNPRARLQVETRGLQSLLRALSE